jgi:bifunctional DNA-binding transcriptional regulator/antitoxin component of YhaV-PrlF toxin-antitoxin module
MREIVSTISSKGQVTIPIEVRRHLGLSTKLARERTQEGGARRAARRTPPQQTAEERRW